MFKASYNSFQERVSMELASRLCTLIGCDQINETLTQQVYMQIFDGSQFLRSL